MIDIIIPNWNGRFLLKTCLDSLQSQSSHAFQTIVVDNGSTDGSVSFIQENFPHVKIIELNENKGFSAAVNSGILASESEWVLLLNNDVEVASDCLEYLENLSNHPQEYDFFALKMIDFHKRTHIDGAGDSVMRGGVGYRLGTMENDSDIYSIKRDVFGACAGAALYRRSMFDSVGLFDEDFFLLYEDVDLSFRAQLKGYKCLYVPEAVVYHKASSSIVYDSPISVYYSHRNLEWVYIKNMPGPLIVKTIFPHIIYDIAAFFYFLICGRGKEFIRAKKDAVKGLKKTLEKRQQIQANRKVDDRYIWNLLSKELFLHRLTRRQQKR